MVEYKIKTRQVSEIDLILPDDLLASHLVLAEIETELLKAYKEGAIAEAERYCNRAILKSEIIISSTTGHFRLPYGADSISQIKDSTDQDIQFYLNPVTDHVTIIGSPIYPIFITAQAGYEVNAVPSDMITCFCMMVATSYENRESISNGTIAVQVPFSHQRILDLHRLPSTGV